jgi:hypothetical protein
MSSRTGTVPFPRHVIANPAQAFPGHVIPTLFAG